MTHASLGLATMIVTALDLLLWVVVITIGFIIDYNTPRKPRYQNWLLASVFKSYGWRRFFLPAWWRFQFGLMPKPLEYKGGTRYSEAPNRNWRFPIMGSSTEWIIPGSKFYDATSGRTYLGGPINLKWCEEKASPEWDAWTRRVHEISRRAAIMVLSEDAEGLTATWHFGDDEAPDYYTQMRRRFENTL